MFYRVWALILKELAAQLRDPRSRRVILLMVIVQVVIYPNAATLEVKNNTLAIYNQDFGVHSIELMQRFTKASAFSTLLILHSQKKVNETINNQKALLGVIIPSDLSKNITSNKPSAIQIIIDGRRSNAGQIAANYIQDMVAEYQANLNKGKMGKIVLSTLTIRNWFNPNLDYKWFILPNIIAFITTLGCLTLTAMSVAREREQGTFEQVLVSPLTPGYIMIGKMIPPILIGIIQATVVLLAAIFIYRVPFVGSILLLYFCLTCYALTLAGIGLLISSISSTQQQAFLGVFAFVVPAVLLSGFVSPIENIPEPLRTITWFNPLRHFNVLSIGIYLKGFNLREIWPDLWPLFVISALTLFMAYIKFKRYAR